MPFTVKDRNHATLIEIEGNFLGSIEGPRFKETLDELKAAGKTSVVVDLSRAKFMDSTGIGTLIGGLTTMRKAGGDIRLAAMDKNIKNVFVITRLLGSVFTDYETAEEALDSFHESKS